MLADLGMDLRGAAVDSAEQLMRHLMTEYSDLAAYPPPPPCAHRHAIHTHRCSGSSIITVVAENDAYIDGLNRHMRNVWCCIISWV